MANRTRRHLPDDHDKHDRRGGGEDSAYRGLAEVEGITAGAVIVGDVLQSALSSAMLRAHGVWRWDLRRG